MEARELPFDTVAPWAAIVPDVGPLTADELAALPDDGWIYEIVKGVLVRMPPSGFEASNIALLLGAALLSFAKAHGRGRVTGEQGGYILNPARPRETEVAPDVGFVRTSRLLPRHSPAYAKVFPGAPDLAVEVASPGQSRQVMGAKACVYLAAGTPLVWLVWPRRQEVDVWHAGDTHPSTTLHVGETLDGEDVVPGFRYPIADLFR